MSSYRSCRVDRTTAERLLAGGPVTADTAPLVAVLRAATAPAYPEELVREEVAVAAFRDTARLDLVPEPRRPSMLKSALAKILTVKAAVIFGVVGSTGVVLATSSGALPGPWADTPADPPATSRTAAPSTPPSVTPTGRPSDAGKPADAGATPSPSLSGLCQAYEAQVRENPGKALESPAFKALITAAGNADQVPTYCDALTSAHPSGKPSDLPTPTDTSTHGNGNPPTTLPTPTSRPQTPGSPTPGAVPPNGATTPTRGD